MAGVKGRSGRKPLSTAAHILAGTFRPDRHGPRPVATVGATALQAAPVPPVPPELVAGLQESGLTFVLEEWEIYENWSPVDRVFLRQAALTIDSLATYQKSIDEHGALLRSARGNAVPHPFLKLQAQANRTLLALLARLNLR